MNLPTTGVSNCGSGWAQMVFIEACVRSGELAQNCTASGLLVRLELQSSGATGAHRSLERWVKREAGARGPSEVLVIPALPPQR